MTIETVPAATSSSLDAHRLPTYELHALSGLSDGEVALLDPRAGRLLHVAISIGAGTAACMATCGVLVPRSAYASMAFVVSIVCAFIAVAREATTPFFVLATVALGALAAWLYAAKDAPLGTLVTIFVVVAAASYAVARLVRAHRRQERGLETVARLYAAAKEIEDLVSALGVEDQLLAAQGSRGDDVRRAHVLASLGKARESVVRALKTERVMRANRAFLHRLAGTRPEFAASDVTRVEGEADDYVRIVQQTADLASNIQAAHDELRRDDRA